MRALCLGLRAGAALVLTAAVWASPALMAAQTQNTGTVSGNVNDAQGGIVLGATAVLTSNDRNAKLTVTVNERGEYLFPQVAPGVYTLTVTAPTFEKFVADTITVNVGENIRIDAPLTLGSAADTVTVEAPSTTVDTRSATIATVIDPELVSNLPVDGENVVALAALLPGVTNVNAPTTFTSDTGGPTYNVSGARNNQNLFLLDGVLWNNVYYNTGLSFPPKYMLQEVSVQLNNYKAQYGRNVGSVFNAVTKSGSNQIHGELWDDIQNTMFDAADYITQHNPHIVENNFGATIGGPIKRDKLFFLLGYTALKGVNEVDTKSQTPTLNERGLTSPGVQRPCVSTVFQGQYCATFLEDFQNTTSYAGAVAGTAGLRNPLYSGNSNSNVVSELNSTYAAQGGVGTSPCISALTTALASYKEYLPNAELPSVCFNPVSTNVLAKYVPLPNSPSGTGGLPYTNVFAPQPQSNQAGFARFDFIRAPHTIGARFYKTETSDTTSNGSIVAAGTTPAVSTYEPDANAAGITAGILDDRWVLTPNLLNTFLAGYKRYVYKTVPTDPTTLITLGGNFTDPGVPALPRFEATNRFQLGSATSSYSYSVNSSLEADESIIYTRGHHTMQFGAQYLNLDYIHRFDQTPQLDSEVQNTEVSSADFLLGLPYQVTVGNSTNYSAVENAFYFYGQDDWRASARLTLNLGLRYELPKPWFQPDGQSVTFVPGYQSYRFPNTPSSFAYQGDPGIPNSIIKTNYTNLAPRFGLAYDAFGNGKTVIRAGFGIFYDTLNANTVGVGAPYHYTATLQQGPGSFSQPLLKEPSVPANYTGPASAQFVLPYSVNFADANVTQPYTEAVNIGFAQRIAAATLEFYYVGKFGRHQIIPYDLNPAIIDCSGSYYQINPTLYCPQGPNTKGAAISLASGTYAQRVKYPNFGYGGQGIVDNNTVGTSNYNGLQIIYTQRSHKSLSTVISYTYSRSLDDQSSGTTNTAALPLTPLVNTNYGPSDFQATHVLNAGWVLNFPIINGGNVVERAVLNGWQFGGIFNARTGNPFNPILSGDQNGTDERPQRPSLNPGYTINDVKLPSNRHRVYKVAEWYRVPSAVSVTNNIYTAAAIPGVSGPTVVSAGQTNTCSSTEIFYGPLNPCPGLGYTGAISRNSLYGPAFIETDFSLRRQINLNERGTRLEFRADAFNVFNTPNLATPLISLALNTASAANLNAGQIISTIGKNASLGSNGRHLQMVIILHY
jgi:hypothetical protein